MLAHDLGRMVAGGVFFVCSLGAVYMAVASVKEVCVLRGMRQGCGYGFYVQ